MRTNNSRTLPAFYAAIGHLIMHMFAACYFVIVLAIEDDWAFSYDELINLWIVGSLLVGLGAVPAGWISDRWSRSGMIAIMFIGLGLASLSCGFSNGKSSLFISLSLLGLFCSIYHPAGISWVVNTSQETGKALGINNIFGGVGVGLGAAMSGMIINFYNWQTAFIVPGLVSLALGGLLIWHIASNRISLANIVSTNFSQNPEKGDYLRIIAIMLISMACIGFVFQILQTSLPKVIDIRLGESLSLGTAKIGMAVAAIYVISGLTNYLGGILADRYSEKLIYVVGILGQGIMLLLLANLSSYILIIVSMIAVALNSGILPAENILLARFAPQKYQSVVYGVKFIVTFVMAPIAVMLISRSYEFTNEFYYLYWVCSAVMISLFFVVLALPVKRYI
jgi:FSR family fosmidomycin resistance protein-like MFS transporter